MWGCRYGAGIGTCSGSGCAELVLRGVALYRPCGGEMHACSRSDQCGVSCGAASMCCCAAGGAVPPYDPFASSRDTAMIWQHVVLSLCATQGINLCCLLPLSTANRAQLRMNESYTLALYVLAGWCGMPLFLPLQLMHGCFLHSRYACTAFCGPNSKVISGKGIVAGEGGGTVGDRCCCNPINKQVVNACGVLLSALFSWQHDSVLDSVACWRCLQCMSQLSMISPKVPTVSNCCN